MSEPMRAERWLESYRAGMFDPGAEPWEDGYAERMYEAMDRAGYECWMCRLSSIPGRLSRIAGIVRCAVRSNPGIGWYDVGIIQAMDLDRRIHDRIMLTRRTGGVMTGWCITGPCTATENMYVVRRIRCDAGETYPEFEGGPVRIASMKGLSKWLSTEVTV